MMTAANDAESGQGASLDRIAEAAESAAVDQIVGEINRTWSSMVSSIIETGRLLVRLKSETAHGQWESLVESRLPFGVNVALRLVQIASHPVLSNPTRAADLPPRWSILAEMVRLDADTIETAIRKGVIHPGMKREDLRALRFVPRTPGDASTVPDTPDEPPPAPSVEDRDHAMRVVHVMASLCNSTPDEIMAPTRHSARATLARQLTVYALSINNGWNATRVARVMGRDRTTVEHARTVIEELRDDPAVDAWIDRACAVLARAQELADAPPERIAAA
ncbi:MAG: hypothetical protein IPK75_12715 [Acidobacteria bacterium]|nr:hypothetical protein [Acidobacteriota bacterium]